MASVEQGVSFIFCLVVDIWSVNYIVSFCLNKLLFIFKDSFLFQCQRYDVVYKIMYPFFSSLSVVTFARASNVAANRGRLCFVFSFQASPVDGSVKISFRVGSNLWHWKRTHDIFFWPNHFLSEMASAKVFETGIPSLAILILGASTLCQEILELPYLTVWAFTPSPSYQLSGKGGPFLKCVCSIWALPK